MLIPLSWLKKYVPVSDSPHELAHKLTMAGIEIGEVRVVGADWDADKIVVGEALRVEAHPNADRLRLVAVDVGGGRTETVVCGAPNVAAGQKIAFAGEGAALFSPRSGKTETLKRARIRGVESRGMVCSALELGVGDDHDGILVLDADAPVGAPLAEYLGDAVLNAEVTPNRPDCLSILGVAHEAAAIGGARVTEPDLSYPEEGEPIENLAKVEIADPDLCFRYAASLIMGVKIEPSPKWMQDALIKAGQRPINNVVDITNYVMLEYGQPLHAFDFDKCRDRTIIVRQAREGETLVTLDGERRELRPPMLTIADSRDAVGLAGVMGGANSEMDENTSSVLLESASFDPVNTRRTRTALDLRTEASDRFERGIRSALAPVGLRRATQLIVELCGGVAAKGIIDLYPTKREPPALSLSRARIRQVLGVDYPTSRVRGVLESLGFEETDAPGGMIDLIEAVEAAPAPERADTLWLKVPYWRSDVSIEDDLVEEVARVIGYDSLPATMLSTPIPNRPPQPVAALKDRLRDLLAAAGMQETISYSLTTLEELRKAGALDESNPPLRVANPLSSRWEYMRTSLRASVLNTLAYNRRLAQGEGLRIFEIGRVYIPKPEAKGRGLPDEIEMAVGALSGPRFPASWLADEDEMGFFDAKGALEQVFSALNLDAAFEPAEDSTLRPGRTARISAGGVALGVAGEVRREVLDGFGLESRPVAMFELRVDALLSALGAASVSYESASRYPESYRDLAVVVDADMSAARIRRIIERHALASRAAPFDIYAGEGVPAGRKSVAFRVAFQSDRGTLTSEQVDRFQNDILRQLRRELGAELRG